MIDECVRIMSAQLRRRENDRMEGNIVLGHEFVVDHLLLILPPAFPFFSVTSSDAQITDRCIEPHVEDLHTDWRKN